MDNNEAREMDEADHGAGPDHEHWLEDAGAALMGLTPTQRIRVAIATAGATPREESDEDAEHCDACGYDLGTHHPRCIKAYPGQQTYDPQAHASDSEMAIAHIYAAAHAIEHAAIAAMTQDHHVDELANAFQRQDNLMDALVNLCKTTGSSINLVFEVAKTLR
jgi:hypothetical protein